MITKEPPKPSLILATPVNVEESRAQRYQRQQSRFRDRGGIFVPSSRNTLADILLGKASPLKKPPRRSVSASPTKRKARTPNGGAQDLVLTARHASSRKSSPRKRGRRSLTSRADDTNVKTTVTAKGTKSGATRLKESQDNSAESKTVSETSSKHRETKSSSREEPLQHVSAKVVKNSEASPMPKPRGRPTKPTETSTKAKKSRGSVGPSKSKGKGKADPAAIIPEHVETGTKNMSTGAASQSFNGISSSTVAAPSKPLLSLRRKSTLYSDGFSEDEYIPKQVKKAKGKTQSTVRDQKKTPKPFASSKQSNEVPPDSPTRNRTGAPQLPDIPEEDEEEVSGENDSNEQLPVSKQQDAQLAKKSRNRSNKRPAQEVEVDEERPHRPKKRVKENGKEDEDTRSDKSKTKALKKTSRKRARSENTVNEAHEEPRKKRKKDVDQSETAAESSSKSSTKPVKVKSQRSTGDDEKHSSSDKKKTSERKKENASVPEKAKPPAAVPVRRGPPKRVLQRLKECQHHDVDNEPDPIDFLS